MRNERTAWLDRRVGPVTVEQAVYALLILIALISRFVVLGQRAASHDEALHTRYSWELYKGSGYAHTPMMHGPFLFHVTALSYWFFGDTDGVARIPVAVIGVLLVAFPYLFRRQLGRAGALATSSLLLISPSVLFFSRYIRMDVPVVFWSLLVIWSIWSYLRRAEEKYLYWFAGGMALMLATKEVAYLYVAILGGFLAVRLVAGLLNIEWSNQRAFKGFQGALACLMVGAVVFGVGVFGQSAAEEAAQEAALDPTAEGVDPAEASVPGEQWKTIQVAGGLLIAGSLAAGVLLVLTGAQEEMRVNPSFDLIILFSTLGLPFMGAVPVKLLGADPLDYSYSAEALGQLATGPLVGWILAAVALGAAVIWMRDWGAKKIRWAIAVYALLVALVSVWTVTSLADVPGSGAIRSAAVMVPLLAISVGVGLWWDWRRWLGAASIFYGIAVTLFTSVFTNGRGLGSGWLGSLGYWMDQQAVERGSQPVYFYFLTVPVYEFLPLVGSIAAGLIWSFKEGGLRLIARAATSKERLNQVELGQLFGFVPFVLWWTLGTWTVYSYAGEKMGWLTVHFAVPMILLTGWVVGRLIQSASGGEWLTTWRRGGWLLPLLIGLFLAALLRGLKPLWTQDLTALQDIDRVLVWVRIGSGLAAVAGALVGIGLLSQRLSLSQVVRSLLAAALVVLAILTIRVAWMASFINQDTAKEWLVYAHGGSGLRQVVDEVEALSLHLHNDLSIRVAYGNDVSTVFYWYFRNYPNAVYFGSTPSRENLDVPIAVVGRANWDKVEPYLANRYHMFEYVYMWWPMEDYRGLTWDRIRGALADPAMRAALWDVLVNRDYERYQQVTGRDHSLSGWPLHHPMRLYVRKDLAAQIWDHGAGGALAEVILPDPYEERFLEDMQADAAIGGQGELLQPRGVALSESGLLVVTDAEAHQVVVFQLPDPAEGEGTAVEVSRWGGRCDLGTGAECVDPDGDGPLPLGAGQFNEPWAVAVGRDDTIYVADTWNHRVQRFSTDGTFIGAWGEPGQMSPSTFYGPRGVAVGSDGRVYVTDTGNKRIQIFDPDGTYLDAFGEGGPLTGQLDEPVGLAFGPGGSLYVADTWNGRVQVFSPEGDPIRQWMVDAWYGQSLENKPYLTVDTAGRLFATDPELHRVLAFNAIGTFLFGFGMPGADLDGMNLPSGIAVAPDGTVYVADTNNGRVLAFDFGPDSSMDLLGPGMDGMAGDP